MIGKRSRPAIGKLAGALRAGIVDSTTSPRSPLECRMGSPRGIKNYNHDHQLGGGGVGLGIVVALDKTTTNNTSNNYGNYGCEVLAKYTICGPVSARSSPIPVINPSSKDIVIRNNQSDYCENNINNNNNNKVEMEMEMMDEEFTYVTCHGPNKSFTTTRVYYDGGDGIEFRHQNVGVFKISPARFSDDHSDSDFLSSCHLCRKPLHGKDIYMYRGEKAFCSTECRQRQIGMDERKEQCRSEASSDVVSSSPYTYNSNRSQIFFSPGIVAV